LLSGIVTWLIFAASSTQPASAVDSVAGRAPLTRPTLSEQVGLFDGSLFQVTTGRCQTCLTPPQARWYFQDEFIAIPAHPGHHMGSARTGDPPFLVWIGSPELIESATLSKDAKSLRLGTGARVPFVLVPQLSTNRSFYNDATARFFADRPLRVRGRMMQSPNGALFEARTMWPEDFRLDLTHAIAYGNPPRISELIEAAPIAAADALETHVLWERPGSSGSGWSGRPVFGFILNGAQGDDDEAHGGHFAVFTGRMGAHGEWQDWLVNNFYDPDVVSEKGIIPAMVPMESYLMDLNSGQAYYRPSYLLVIILAQDRIPRAYQGAVQETFLRLYRHDLDYDHSRSNCAGLSIDIVRRAGWDVPRRGPTSRIKAAAAFAYLSVTDRSLASGQKIFHYFAEEQTRLLPRVTFEAMGEDVLALLRGSRPTERPTGPMEQWLMDDVEAIALIRVPQLPSSRARGTFPVDSLAAYQQRVPVDRSQWKSVTTGPRPFPDHLRAASTSRRDSSLPSLAISGSGLFLLLGLLIYRRVAKKQAPSSIPCRNGERSEGERT
jgi:hypothetical protein